MNLDLTSNENAQNLIVEKTKSDASVDSFPTSEKAQEIAVAAFARLDPSARSSLASKRQAFEEAEGRLIAANKERDKAWSVLSEELQKKLAKATRNNPNGKTSEYLDLKPAEIPKQAFETALRARFRQLQVRESFYRYRADCCKQLIDRFLMACAGSWTLDAPFPAAEFEDKAVILKDLRFCESVEEAMKIAEARWNASRPCVVKNRRQERAARETQKEKQKRIQEIKRKTLRRYARSAEWKSYASSFSVIVGALSVSGVFVLVLWLTFAHLRLVDLLGLGKILPIPGVVSRLSYVAAILAWPTLAFVYRNVVLLRLKCRSLFKESRKEENEE